MGDAVEDGHEVLGVKRPPAGEQLVEEAADGKEIAAAVDLRAPDLFGGHVVGSTDDVARPRHRSRRQTGDAEVHDLHGAVGVEEDVGRLDVAMDDSRLVRAVQACEHARDDGDDPIQRHGALAHRVREVLPFEQLHGDVGRAVCVVAQIEHSDDARMGHLGDSARLALEALLELGIVGDPGHHHLESDVSFEDRVVRQVDHAHRAPTEHAHHGVLTDTLTWHRRGCVRGGRRCGLAHGECGGRWGLTPE